MKTLFKSDLLPFSVPQADRRWLTILAGCALKGNIYRGPELCEFEREFADYIGVQYAISFSSARYALYLIYKFFECKGREVVMPAYTCIPAMDAVRWAGARPRFVDIELDTYNPVFDESLLTEKNIGAVCLSYLYGLVGGVDDFLKFGLGKRVPIIEDAAICLGGAHHGRKTGSIGDAAVFSLQSSKIITAWKGGVVTTNNHSLYQFLRKEREALADPPILKLLLNIAVTCLRAACYHRRFYGIFMYPIRRLTALGFFNKIIASLAAQNPREAITGEGQVEVPGSEKVRFTNLQAALAMDSFKKIDGILEIRRRAAGSFTAALKEDKIVRLPAERTGQLHAYGRYPIRIPGVSKFDLEKIFLKQGIELSLYYPYICPDMFFSGGQKRSIRAVYPNAVLASRETVLLPMHTFLKECDIRRVIDAVKELRRRARE